MGTLWVLEEPVQTVKKRQFVCFSRDCSCAWLLDHGRGRPGAAQTQADGHGWVGGRGRPRVAASQTLGTHHAYFPRAEAVMLRLLLPNGEGKLCQKALNPLKMQNETPGRAPASQNRGRRWAWKQWRPEIMGFPLPCWFYSDQDASKPPELCLWTGQRDPGSGAPRPAGRAGLGRAGWPGGPAPPLPPPAPSSARWRRSAPCRPQALGGRRALARAALTLAAGAL